MDTLHLLRLQPNMEIIQEVLEGAGLSYSLYEDNIALRIEREHLLRLLEGTEMAVKIFLQDGNYSAMAFGCLDPKEISV